MSMVNFGVPYTGYQPFDPAEAQEKALEIQARKDERLYRAAQMRRLDQQWRLEDRKQGERDEFRAALRRGAGAKELYGISPELAIAHLKALREQEKEDRLEKAAELEHGQKLNRTIADLAAGAMGIGDPLGRALHWGRNLSDLIETGQIPASDFSRYPVPDQRGSDAYFALGYGQKEAEGLQQARDKAARENLLFPQQYGKAVAENQTAQQTALGQTPIQPYQQAQLNQEPADLRTFRTIWPGLRTAKGIQDTPQNFAREFLKYQELTRQPAAMSPERFQQAKELKEKPTIGDLTSGQMVQVNSLARQYDNHPLVKSYNEIAQKHAIIRGILDKPGLGGPGDLALVYEFMKALDPTSVVRESEYANAAQSGNIFSGAFAKFNGMLKPEGGFMPPGVKQAFYQLVGQRLQVNGRQAKGLYDDYGRRIEKITGQPGGTDWLTDPTTLLAPQQTPGGLPKPGDEYMGSRVKSVTKVK